MDAMSVETPGTFVVRAPTTTGDDGKPSGSLLRDVRRVLALMDDERLLVAQELCESVRARLNARPFPSKHSWHHRSNKQADDHEYRAAKELLRTKKNQLDNLEKRAAVIRRAKQTLNVDEDWVLSQTMFGVTTYYRREEDNSLSVKMDGELSGVPLFEQVAVLREVDLHYKWAPFCSSSLTIKDLDKLDTVAWVMVGLPQFGLARDGCFRAFGCDNMMEDGCIYLVGQGVQDRQEGEPYQEEYFLEGMEGIDIPDPPTRMGSGRMTIRNFSAEIHVLSPTRLRTLAVANINPNLTLIPQSLLDFLMRKLCGVMFLKLQHAAKKASSDPVRNVHAQRMRQDDAFYEGWLMPKFQSYCELQGWTMPPVPAFNLTDEELEREFRLNATSRSAPNVESAKSSDESPTSVDEIHPSASAPDLHIQNSDSESDISSLSGFTTKSIFRNNPIAQYLREVEERTQREKERKIAEGRARAAARLRRRSLSQDDQRRLLKLKETKARRVRARTRSLGSESSSLVEDGQNKDEVAGRFRSHGPFTRLVVMVLLASIFVTVLYSDVLLGFDSTLRIHADTRALNALLDMYTFVYLSMSAFFHFELCYVALIYAFDSLEIGTKAGHSSRQYYGQTIRLVVAGESAAIVAICIVRAVASVLVRVGLWYGLQARTLWNQQMEKAMECVAMLLGHVPEQIRSLVTFILSGILWCVRRTGNVTTSIGGFLRHWVVIIFFRSNFVGRFIARIFGALITRLAALMPSWNEYSADVMAMYSKDRAEWTPWRGKAVDMVRPLLTYSAVFAISAVILFHVSTKSRGTASTRTGVKSEKERKVEHEGINTKTVSIAPSVPSAEPVRRYYPQPISSISIQDEIIPEGEEYMSVSVTPPSSNALDGTSDATRKNLWHLRLRKKKTKMVSEGAFARSRQSADIKRMQTY